MKNGQVFFNEIKAYFNLRRPKINKPTNIYLVVRINNVQRKHATGVKVYPTQWSFAKQEAVLSHRLTELDYRNNTIVNNRLNELLLRLMEFKYYICNNPEQLGKAHSILRQFLYKGEVMEKKENALLWYRKAVDAPNNNITDSTKINYLTRLKILEDYVKTLDVNYLTFDMVNDKLVKGFQNWLFKPYDEKGNVRSTRTIHNTVVAIKTILCWADEKISTESYNGIKNFKPVKVKQEKTKIVLTDEEILQLYNAELTGKQKEMRDVFILQCEMGQRFSDMCNLNNGRLSEDGNMYTIVQQKTKQQVTIPLSDTAKQILAKYNYKIPIYLLNITDKELKKIAQKAGLNREVLITREVKGKIETTTEPIWKHISSHLARRSFVTNWLKAGLDSHVIKGVTGHKTEEAFERYNKLSSEDAAQVMLNAQKKTETIVDKHTDDDLWLKLLLSNSSDIKTKYYAIDRDIDISQYELTSQETDFINKTADTFEVGTPSLKIKKIIDKLVSLGIVVRLDV